MPISRVDGSEFDVNNDELTPISISVEGLEGVGKSFFGLMTCPVPLVHVNFSDRDVKGYLYQMSEERRKATTLYDFRPNTPKGWTRKEGEEHLAALSQIAQDHMTDGKLKGGTFVIDSGTSWWEVMTDVYVEPVKEQQQRDYGKQLGGIAYGPANLIVKSIFNWLKNQGAAIVLTHQKAQVWGADGPIAGAYRSKINSQIPYLVEVRLDLYMKCDKCGGKECQINGHVGRSHWAKITKFGMNTDFVGMDLPNPTFAQIYRLYTNRSAVNIPEMEDNGG